MLRLAVVTVLALLRAAASTADSCRTTCGDATGYEDSTKPAIDAAMLAMGGALPRLLVSTSAHVGAAGGGNGLDYGALRVHLENILAFTATSTHVVLHMPKQVKLNDASPDWLWAQNQTRIIVNSKRHSQSKGYEPGTLISHLENVRHIVNRTCVSRARGKGAAAAAAAAATAAAAAAAAPAPTTHSLASPSPS